MRLRRESPKTDKDVKILTMIKRHRGEGGNKKLLNLWIPALIRRGRPNSPLESVLFWIEFQICSFACHQFIPSLIVLGLNYPNPQWYCPTTQKGGTKRMCIVWCWWRSWWWQGGGSDKRELDIGCALCSCVHCALVHLSSCVHCALLCTVHWSRAPQLSSKTLIFWPGSRTNLVFLLNLRQNIHCMSRISKIFNVYQGYSKYLMYI